MKTRGVSDKVASEIDLARRLSECPKITRYDDGEHKEAWALAHAFGDLEGSFRAFLDTHLPALMQKSLSDDEIYDLLLNIGEEFRHILYHIMDPKFYGYLQDSPKSNDSDHT